MLNLNFLQRFFMSFSVLALAAVFLLLSSLLCMPTFGQSNPHTVLQDALVLTNRGNFETAARLAKATIDSRQLNGNELGRGYIILAVAYREAVDLADAQIAFAHALQVLEHDPKHRGDYASVLENYAEFYGKLGQLDVAAPMWRKAFHLRQEIGDHTGIALCLTRLAELALARNRVREADRYLEKASKESKASPDFTDDDKSFLFETQGGLAIAEHHAPAAVAAYQHALELVERSRGERHWLAGWEHMLLGKAYAESADFRRASANMRIGLTILDHTLGQKNPNYFAAELAYSRVLDQVGLHADAAQLRAAGEKASKDYYGGQCAGFTINAAALR